MANLILWQCYNASHAPVRTEGCYQLASWLRQNGYTVKVIDFCHMMTTEQLVAMTEKYYDTDTLAIGVSSTFWQHFEKLEWVPQEADWVVNARNLLDSRKSGIKWILGGSGSISTNLKMDWIKIHGFAEDDLLKWLDENKGKLKLRKPFDITTCEKYFSEDDFIKPHEVLPIEMGRGCQFKCRFCSFPLIGKKKGTYLRSFDVIKEELIRNYNEYGTTKYFFLDDTVNESEEKVRAIAEMANELPFKIEWTGYLRLDLIWSRSDTIELLKQSGLRSAYFGIESFHSVAASAVGKGWNSKHAKDFLLELKEKWNDEITWRLSFIIGLPGEGRDSIDETLEWCIKNEMYDFVFYVLSINRTENKIWKSEFAIEHEKYGYSFPDPEKFYMWKNDIWDRNEALKFTNEIMSKCKGDTLLSSWQLSEIVSNGYEYDDWIHTKRKDIDYSVLTKRTKLFVDNYIKQNLSR